MLVKTALMQWIMDVQLEIISKKLLIACSINHAVERRLNGTVTGALPGSQVDLAAGYIVGELL
ncbi:hypothetical protein MOU97_002522 [Vibrio vulnificus]|uniref:hypothetical protein n=1 Tax=Vibrio vulnificus TaxID=672 RepID=UPI000578104D|nr:hypothetical protein [Vibrio vulnificus]EIV1775405.1 hypothetical protein [Vibrio vulnificus]EIZ0990424.1 hypothetical protein [Vibrio vulnificus]EJT1339493.1 hypothetical protein [Vibrio vulnificus]EJV2651096.1 hypothetical protein [Vibrio vulnificus]ELV8755474.1 hypothetical protein [Vibrio vulnificus]